eukprot:16336-Heterococcus_DN1.PRE.6
MVSSSAAVQQLHAAQRLPEAARSIDSVLQRHQAAATVGSWHALAIERLQLQVALQTQLMLVRTYR